VRYNRWHGRRSVSDGEPVSKSYLFGVRRFDDQSVRKDGEAEYVCMNDETHKRKVKTQKVKAGGIGRS